MIKEFAIEPEFMNSWQRVRYINDKFGVYNGRLLSLFPKKWLKLVYGNLNSLPPKDKKKIEEILTLMKKHKKLINSFRDYDSSLSWIKNAVQQQSIKPFTAIISDSSEPKHPYIINDADLSENNEKFRTTRSKRIRRTAHEISECAISLIKHCKEIIFVDPHFEKLNSRHINPLIKILSLLSSENGLSDISITYITGNEVDHDHFEKEIRRKLHSRIPNGMEITFAQCKSADLHNRFIVTEIGTMAFMVGLDEKDSDESVEYDDVSILDNEHSNESLTLYSKITILKSVLITNN